jgi:hypothetical protein
LELVPGKSSAAPRLNLNAEVAAIPFPQGFGVTGLEEDPADTRDPRHLTT